MKITQPMIVSFLIGLIAGAVIFGLINSYRDKSWSASESKEIINKANSIQQR